MLKMKRDQQILSRVDKPPAKWDAHRSKVVRPSWNRQRIKLTHPQVLVLNGSASNDVLGQTRRDRYHSRFKRFWDVLMCSGHPSFSHQC